MRTKTFIDLLIYKTGVNLRTEVSQYYLNYLWWVIEPILSMGMFYIVFGIFLNRGTDHFVAFLLCGLTFWNWFSNTVYNASASIMQGQGLMQQVNIQKVFFPLEVILQDCFKLMFALSLLLVFLLFYPTPVSITWFALPLLMFIQLCLVAGMAILCAAVVPFLPDLKFIIGTALHLMFFGSGIFYSVENVVLPEHQFIMYINPICGLLKAYRQILIYDSWPDWFYLAKVFLFALILLVFALWLVFRFNHIYPRICQQ